MSLAPQSSEEGGPPRFDWSVGQYEHTAEQLLPAATRVVERAELRRGERVLDVGCGTGNAALIAAAAGATVTGVDPAGRLLDVARAQAAAQGFAAEFLLGDAAKLPIADKSVDVALSVFGVIFAPDPYAAAQEIARVVAPEGRVLISAWVPGGAISQANRIAQDAVNQALGLPGVPTHFPWHDPNELRRLFATHGFAVTVEEHSLAFTARSARAYLETEWATHPLAVAGRTLLERHPELAETVRRRALELLEDANEAATAFRISSRYVIATARRA